MNRLKSKALFGFLVLLAVLMLSSATKSTLFTKSVAVTKVYPHRLGYRVVYFTDSAEIKEVYLPVEMFKIENGSKIFYGYDKSFPYLQIFWESGELSHVKLYVKEDFRDVTWGSFNNPNEYDKFFTSDNIKFEF